MNIEIVEEADLKHLNDNPQSNGKNLKEKEDETKEENTQWQTNNNTDDEVNLSRISSLNSDNSDSNNTKDKEDDNKNTDLIWRFLYKISGSQEKPHNKYQYAKMMNDFVTDPSSDKFYQIKQEQIISDNDIKPNA